MTLSIIVPVYNVEKYLRECLDSISCLQGFLFEVILIDDGSKDVSGAICDEFVANDNRFRVIHQKNVGVSAARNAGLDAARGEWIWFVDSDDVIDAHNLNHLAKQGLWRIIADYDYVMFDLMTFNDGDTLNMKNDDKGINAIVEISKDKNDFLLKHICCHHPRLFYKKSWMMTGPHQPIPLRFTQGLKVCEDGEFQYKYLMYCQKPIRINAVIYYYRQRDGSAIRNANANRQIVTDTLVVLNNLRTFMIETNMCLEPWLEKRFIGTFKVIMVAVLRCKIIDRDVFQSEIRSLIDEYAASGYNLKRLLSIKAIYLSVRLYLLMLNMYFKIKGIK